MKILNCTFLLTLFCLSLFSCSNDVYLVDESLEAAEVESSSSSQKKENFSSSSSSSKEKVLSSSSIKAEIESPSSEGINEYSSSSATVKKDPLLKTFSLLKINNKNLSADIYCEIRKESIVECFANAVLDSMNFVADFLYDGDEILYSSDKTEEMQVFSGKTSLDFGENASLTVGSGQERKKYLVYLYPYTGLPYLSVETENEQDIVNKTNDVKSVVRIFEKPGLSRNLGDMACVVSGRGNSTWLQPKKPYKIKFEKKESPFSMHSNKSWVLLANHYDKTMIRNHVASYIASLADVPWSPQSQYVELILNGVHKGTYQLYEKVKVGKDRVAIEKNDFLLEVDNHPHAEDVKFSIDHFPKPVKIVYPDVSENDDDYTYIKEVFERIDSVLFSDDFLDEKNGYKKYVDIDALVEWYVVSEIVKNSSNHVNWYMTYERKNKLTFGPFWDYDLAFANSLWVESANNVEDFWMNSVKWFSRFIQDPEFVQKSKERFAYFYSHKADIIEIIKNAAEKISLSAAVNQKIWNVYDCENCSNEQFLQIYSDEVAKVQTWLDARFEWLKASFDSL